MLGQAWQYMVRQIYSDPKSRLICDNLHFFHTLPYTAHTRPYTSLNASRASPRHAWVGEDDPGWGKDIFSVARSRALELRQNFTSDLL